MRGIFLLLAFIQHYAYQLNYVLVKTDIKWFGTKFRYLFEMNKLLPCSSFLLKLMTYFGPWVTQIFLSLACFNLYLKFHNKLQWEQVNKHFQKLFSLYVLFFFESLIMEKNLLSIVLPSPVQTWFIVLGLTLLALMLLNYKIYTALCFSLGLFVFTPWFDNGLSMINEFIGYYLKFDENYFNNPFIFIISSWIGVSMGKLYLSKKMEKEYLLSILISAALALFVGLNAPVYKVLPINVYAFEYSWAYNFVGSTCVWFVIAAVFLMGLYLESIGKPLKSKFLSFISKNSLMLFLFHQVFFKFFIIPLRFLLTPFIGEIENSLKMTLVGIGGYLFFYYIFSTNFKKKN